MICPNCGKDTPLSSAETSFCVHCGTAIHMPPAEPEPAENLAAEAAISPEGLLLQLQAAYQEYVDQVRDYRVRESIGGRVFDSILGGNKRFHSDAMHDAFAQKMMQTTEALTQALRQTMESNPQRTASVAEEALRYLLLESKAPTGSPTNWMFLAMEHYALPLVDFIELAVLEDITTAYRAKLKAEIPLPNQSKVLKELRCRVKKG